MRKTIFNIIEKSDGTSRVSHFYDVVMILAIAASLVPLAFKSNPPIFVWTEWITTVLFFLDYLLRWWTADLKLGRGKLSFLLYPFTAMAIIDVLSVLPTLLMIHPAFRALKVFRLIRALRVLRLLKSFRYSRNVEIISIVFKKQKRSLVAVCGLAIGYIFLSALVVFSVEPDTFPTFFDAVYWATVSLTTVGYGDIYTVSIVGRLITMISAILGVAIVALPAGIITAGYMSEIQKDEEKKK